jgi:hypothetical protein
LTAFSSYDVVTGALRFYFLWLAAANFGFGGTWTGGGFLFAAARFGLSDIKDFLKTIN